MKKPYWPFDWSQSIVWNLIAIRLMIRDCLFDRDSEGSVILYRKLVMKDR